MKFQASIQTLLGLKDFRFQDCKVLNQDFQWDGYEISGWARQTRFIVSHQPLT